MGTMPDTSMYGSQTLLGPAWVEMDEDELSAAAASFEALAAHLRGVVVPQLQGQMMTLSADWTGSGSTSAMGEATAIINGHEVNAAQASAIATKLRRMEASVAKVKSLLNATAQQTQEECESIMSGPGFGPEKLAAVQSRVAMGLAQNMSEVTAGTTELGDGLGVPTSGLPGMSSAGNPQQAMQMVTQMASKAGQLPQQLGKMGGGGGGMQQLMQPLQQLTSMFGKGGGKGGGAPSPFSNHPAAGGTGPRSGAGMARGGMPGGGGGGAARTPLMAKMVGGTTAPVATAPAPGAAAGGRVVGGSAPVGAAGGAGGGTGGMMGGGGRGNSGGARTAMAVPAPLDHDLTDDDGDDDDW